jgi:hypothetical protein
MSPPNTSLFPITPIQLNMAADRMIERLTEERDSQRPAFEKRLAEWKQPSRWQSFLTGASRKAPEWVEKHYHILPDMAPEYHRQTYLDSRIAKLNQLNRLSEKVATGERCWLCKEDMEALGL